MLFKAHKSIFVWNNLENAMNQLSEPSSHALILSYPCRNLNVNTFETLFLHIWLRQGWVVSRVFIVERNCPHKLTMSCLLDPRIRPTEFIKTPFFPLNVPSDFPRFINIISWSYERAPDTIVQPSFNSESLSKWNDDSQGSLEMGKIQLI